MPVEPPKYRHRREIRWASKVRGWEYNGRDKETYTLHLAHAYAVVSESWFNTHHPEQGGYYAVYDDQEAIHVPASLFEKLYDQVPTKETKKESA